MGDLILSIDVGTTAVKAGLYAESGESRATVAVGAAGNIGGAVDAEAVWQAVSGAIQSIMERPGASARDVSAVVVTGQGDGLWTIDDSGVPAGPAYQWNDTRAEGVVKEWEDNGTIDAAYRLNDTVMWPGTSAALWVWLRENSPEHMQRTRWVVTAPDWINFRLTGEVATDITNAGIPFLDPDSRTWNSELMTVLGCEDIASRLPPIQMPGERLGVVTERASEETGLIAGTPVFTGAIDVVAMFRGLGFNSPGSVVAVLGTTAVALALTESRSSSPVPVGATVPLSSPGRFMRVIGASSGTSTLDWYLRSIFGSEPGSDVLPRFWEEVNTVSPEAAHVMMLPFLAGERAPFLAPDATGAFLGIGPETRRADLSYAVVEGITMALRHCVESVTSTVETVLLTGGGASSPEWQQLAADVLGHEILIDERRDRACVGAVSLVTGSRPDVERGTKRVIPTRWSSIQRQRFGTYVSLTDLMQPIWGRVRSH